MRHGNTFRSDFDRRVERREWLHHSQACIDAIWLQVDRIGHADVRLRANGRGPGWLENNQHTKFLAKTLHHFQTGPVAARGGFDQRAVLGPEATEHIVQSRKLG